MKDLCIVALRRNGGTDRWEKYGLTNRPFSEAYLLCHWSYLPLQSLRIIYIVICLRQFLVKLIVVVKILSIELRISLHILLLPDLAL